MNLRPRALLAPVAIALAASACTVPAPADSDLTIAEQLLSDSAGDNAAGYDNDWYDFDIATNAVLLFPGLVEAASNPDAELTVFLPNDRAFQVLVADLTGEVVFDEESVFDAVASLGVDTVEAVLNYHIVGAAIPASAALESDGAVLETIGGGEVTVDVTQPLLSLIEMRDQDPSDDDAAIVFSKFNYGGELENGFIHGLSLVMRPVDLP